MEAPTDAAAYVGLAGASDSEEKKQQPLDVEDVLFDVKKDDVDEKYSDDQNFEGGKEETKNTAGTEELM